MPTREELQAAIEALQDQLDETEDEEWPSPPVAGEGVEAHAKAYADYIQSDEHKRKVANATPQEIVEISRQTAERFTPKTEVEGPSEEHLRKTATSADYQNALAAATSPEEVVEVSRKFGMTT